MRISWHEYFMGLATLVSERATCDRLHVGAVIVKDRNIIATGYNGSVGGTSHCCDKGCDVVDNHCVRTIHAETNAILQCAKNAVSPVGATIYVTHFPCYNCAKHIAQVGIAKVVYLNGYNNDFRTTKLFAGLGIECIKLD